MQKTKLKKCSERDALRTFLKTEKSAVSIKISRIGRKLAPVKFSIFCLVFSMLH